MPEFSTLDGFADLTECMAEMIKYLANEPSVGLFYVQQHTHNAVPNVVRLRGKVTNKSHEMTLHTEDSEDSIAMVRSMKECGSPIADEMIRDIKKTLVVMSTKQPRRGLIHDSWGPTNWGRSQRMFGQQHDGEKNSYFSSVFKNAKKRASNFKWGPLDSEESLRDMLPPPDRTLSVASGASSSSLVQEVEADELPLSSPVADEPREEDRGLSLSSGLGENYDVFKAEKEAKLEEWLRGHGDQDDHRGETSDQNSPGK